MCKSPLMLVAQVKNNNNNKLHWALSKRKHENEGDKAIFRNMYKHRET